MKKKKESKMTKPIVLDEKIPKGVDKTLVAGNSIIMTQTTHSYDEFIGAGKKAKTTKPNKSKESKQPKAATKKKTTAVENKPVVAEFKEDTVGYRILNGPPSDREYYLRLLNDKDRAMMLDLLKQKEQNKQATAASKNESKPIKVNIPTDAINLALSEAKMKELQKKSKKKKINELVAKGADRKVAKAMVDAAYTCGVEHTLGDTSKNALPNRSISTENFCKVKEQLQSGDARNLAFKKPMSFYREHSVDEAIAILKKEALENQKASKATTSSKPAVSKKTEASKQTQPVVSTAKPTATAPKKAEPPVGKRRVYKSMPKNYSVVQGTVAQNDGTILIHNGKPLFKQNKDGTTELAKDRRGKPAHKVAVLVVDPKAYSKSKNINRSTTK